MPLVTVTLPEEDLKFLRDFATRHGTSAEAVLADQAKGLRRLAQANAFGPLEKLTGLAEPGVRQVDGGEDVEARRLRERL